MILRRYARVTGVLNDYLLNIVENLKYSSKRSVFLKTENGVPESLTLFWESDKVAYPLVSRLW
jgi:hypothetical protein